MTPPCPPILCTTRNGGVPKEGRGGWNLEEDASDGKKTVANRGLLTYHTGASHENKTEKTITLRVCRYQSCGSCSLSQSPPRIKLSYDFASNGAMRIVCVAYMMKGVTGDMGSKTCPGSGPTLPGTSLGSKAVGFVKEYYVKRSTDHTVSYYFDT